MSNGVTERRNPNLEQFQAAYQQPNALFAGRSHGHVITNHVFWPRNNLVQQQYQQMPYRQVT